MSYAYTPTGQYKDQSHGYDHGDPDRFLYDGLPEDVRTAFKTPVRSYTSPTPSSMQRSLHILGTVRRIGLSRVKVLLALLWFFVLWWGEKQAFNKAIAACHWDRWEQWVGLDHNSLLEETGGAREPTLIASQAFCSRSSSRRAPFRPSACRPSHLSGPAMALVHIHDCTH